MYIGIIRKSGTPIYNAMSAGKRKPKTVRVIEDDAERGQASYARQALVEGGYLGQPPTAPGVVRDFADRRTDSGAARIMRGEALAWAHPEVF